MKCIQTVITQKDLKDSSSLSDELNIGWDEISRISLSSLKNKVIYVPAVSLSLGKGRYSQKSHRVENEPGHSLEYEKMSHELSRLEIFQ